MQSVALVVLALLVSSAATTGCRTAGPAQPDIFLITVDTLRADHLSSLGYERETSPLLDDLFSSGVVFERAYAPQAITGPSLTSVLTGQLPQQHGVRVNVQLLPRGIETVADVLAAHGYTTAAFVSNAVLTDEAMGLGARFDHYDDSVDEKEPRRDIYERNAGRTTDALLAWLLQNAERRRPLFTWVHYIDPHGPYEPPATPFTHEGTLPILDDTQIADYIRDPDVADALDYVDRYDGEIRFADGEIARLIESLPGLGFEEPYIVFAADHGESMTEHGAWFRHGHGVWEEVTHVPLLLRGPGLAAERVTTPVSIADIAPTVLAFAGARFDRPVYGRPLTAPDPARPVFASGGRDPQDHAMWLGDHKWTARIPSGRSASVVELGYYDLRGDPGELSPQAWPDGAASERFHEFLAADPVPGGVPDDLGEMAGTLLRVPKDARPLSPEIVARLRALGYLR